MAKATILKQPSLFEDDVQQEPRVSRFCHRCAALTGSYAGWCAEHQKVFSSMQKLFIPSEHLAERRRQYHEMFRYSYTTGQPLEKSLLRVWLTHKLPFLPPWVMGDYGLWHLQDNSRNMVEYILHRALPHEHAQWLESEQMSERVYFDMTVYPYDF